MTYDEAYSKFNKDGNPDVFFTMILEGNNQNAFKYVMDITGCDETTAKAIVLDLSDGLITQNTNKLNNNNCSTISNIPKCPTCQSTNIKRISTATKAVNTVAFGLLGTKRHKSFHCNNCGYEW